MQIFRTGFEMDLGRMPVIAGSGPPVQSASRATTPLQPAEAGQRVRITIAVLVLGGGDRRLGLDLLS
jgi:hypothetical protein